MWRGDLYQMTRDRRSYPGIPVLHPWDEVWRREPWEWLPLMTLFHGKWQTQEEVSEQYHPRRHDSIRLSHALENELRVRCPWVRVSTEGAHDRVSFWTRTFDKFLPVRPNVTFEMAVWYHHGLSMWKSDLNLFQPWIRKMFRSIHVVDSQESPPRLELSKDGYYRWMSSLHPTLAPIQYSRNYLRKTLREERRRYHSDLPGYLI
jgi:hypothetical protein